MIIIYTHGKVASQTIEQSFNNYRIPEAVKRTHLLAEKGLRKNIRRWRSWHPKFDIGMESARQQTAETLLLGGEITRRAKSGERIYLICGVRDLVTQAFSAVFESLATSNPSWEADFFADPERAVKALRESIFEYARQDSFMTWFDAELKDFTGYDVRNLSFDPVRGWETVKHGAFDILIFKQECLGSGAFKAIADWTGYPLQEPVSYNVGNSKETGAFYRLAQETIRFTEHELDEIYNGESADLFYSAAERAKGHKRWSGHMDSLNASQLIERYRELKTPARQAMTAPAPATPDQSFLPPISWEQRMQWRGVIFDLLSRSANDLHGRTVALTSPEYLRWASWISKLGPRRLDVTGIGQGNEMHIISKAYQIGVRYKEANPDTRFVAAVSRPYDAICSIGTSDEMFDPLAVFSFFRRDLTESGLLILTMRAIDDRPGKREIIMTAPDQYERPPPTIDTIRSVLVAEGFRIAEIQTSPCGFRDPSGPVVVRLLLAARLVSKA